MLRSLSLIRLILCLFALAFAVSPCLEAQPYETVIIDGREAVADELLVKEKNTAQPQQSATIIDEAGMRVVRNYASLPGIKRIKLKAPSNKTADQKAADLKAKLAAMEKSGAYEYVEPNWIVYANRVPSDSAFSNGTLWGLRNTGQNGGTAGADINVTRAWDITVGSSNVVVGVIDTGIRYTHADLADNMWRNPDEIPNNGVDDDNNGYVDDVFGINAITGSGDPFDDNDHGTHCAGTIGAVNDNNPHVGVAWNVQLMALKFLSANGSGSIGDAIECLNYAVDKGAHLTNNSWGGGGYSQAMEDALFRAHNIGQLFVAAAGNDGSNIDNSPQYPASYNVPNVVSVAALDRSDRLASFSNYGAVNVDLGAPGVSIYSSVSTGDNQYSSFNGTSMASPHVAGVAALVYSQFPGIHSDAVKSRLLGSATPISALNGRAITGGRVNAYGALTIAADGELEVFASAAEQLVPGDSIDFFVTVSDLGPVTGASVDAGFGSANTRFLDNGVAPDATAGDSIYSGRLVIPGGSNEATMAVTVSAAGKSPFSGNFTFPVINPPPNDDFANRIPLQIGTTFTEGTNRSSTSENNEPNQPGVAGGKSVWWSWTAPSTGSFEITTSGSNYDTTLAVFTGTSLASLTLIDANDDGSGLGLRSRVTFNATAGQTFQIRVDGYAGSEGDIVLNYTPPGGSTNSPPTFTQQPQSVSIREGESVTLASQAIGSGPISYQWFFDGTRISGATSAQLSINNTEQTDSGVYHIEATNPFGTTESEPAQLSVNPVVVRPNNDDFADAELLPGAAGSVENMDNREATGEVGEPSHASVSTPLNSLWWKWQAPSNGEIEIDTFGSDFDTTLAAYTGQQLSSLIQVAANDDAGALQSQISFEVVAGQVYYIAVDGYSSSVGSIKLTYEFTSFGGTPPPNDQFANRAAIAQGISFAVGNNLNATGEADEPNHANASLPLGSSWWSWTAAQNGQLTISSSGSDFGNALAIYTGSAVNALQSVAFDTSSGGGNEASVTFPVSIGLSYAIAVDGLGAAQGNIVLTLTFVPDSSQGPINDQFARARQITGSTASTTGTNVDATEETNEPNHAGASSPIESVWWYWTAPAAGDVAIDTLGSSFDTTLAIYTGNAVGSLSQVAANDDVSGSRQSQVFFEAQPGQTYRIAVDGFSSDSGDIVLNLDFVPAVVGPTNDDFADRVVLTGNQVTASGTNIDATGETGEPNHAGLSNPIASIWYEYTPNSDGDLVINTFGSNFDTTLAVYTGSSVGTLSQVVANDDTSGVQSEVGLFADGGTTYYIAVDGFGSAEGAVALNLQFVPVVVNPGNDHFADRDLLSGNSLTVNSNNEDATGETGEPNHAGISSPLNSLWWEWTASGPGELTVNTFGSNYDTSLAVYTGSTLAGLSTVASNDDSGSVQSEVAFRVESAGTYVIAVDGFSSATGDITLNLDFQPDELTAPANDNFASRELLTGFTDSASGSTEFATGETNEPNHADISIPFNSVWYEYVPTESGTLTVDTFGSSYDTSLAIYTGTTLGSLVEVNSNDDSGSLQSMVEIDVFAGQAYKIAVDGYSGAFGAYQLNLTFVPANGGNNNDHFANAAIISDRVATVTGNNQDATGEPGEPNHTGNSEPINSLWWRWTAPEDGVLSLDTYGSTFDTTLGVYIGGSIGALTLIAENDNFITLESELRIQVFAGQTYHIAVDGFADEVGDVTLNLEFFTIDPAGPPNDDFADARVVQGTFFAETFAYTIGASGETNEPDHAGVSEPNRSIWYHYTAPGAGTVFVDTLFSNFDTTLAVYTGTSLNNLQEVVSNDDSPDFDGVISSVNFNAAEGQEFYIAVSGFGGDVGLVELYLYNELNATAPPANDTFAQAFTLPGANGSTNGLNLFATGENGEPNHAGAAAPLNSIWWEWTAPQNGEMTLNTHDSDFDTVLAVYTGTAVSNLTEIASNDDAPGSVTSEVSFTAQAGQVYAIAVDSFDEAAVGYAVLNYDFTGLGSLPVITQHPANAAVLIGESASFSVAATSDTPLSYQWQRRDGGSFTNLPGKTTASLIVTNLQLADDGAEFRCVVTNQAGATNSNAATLTVEQPSQLAISATQSGSNYTPGADVTISSTITYQNVASLGFRVNVPSGWEFVSDTEAAAISSPQPGDQGAIDWVWTTPPASPFTFTYTLQTSSDGGERFIEAEVVAVDGGGAAFSADATPHPLVLEGTPFHSTDNNRNFLLDLPEILTTVNLFNYNNGSSRTGEYHLLNGVYAPGPGAISGTHSTDYNQNGRIETQEILRTVGIYNYRDGNVRTGQYHPDGASVDGFAPGPESGVTTQDIIANATASLTAAPNVTAYRNAGGTVFLSFVLDMSSDVSGLAFSLQLPAGWTYQGSDIQGVVVAPTIDQSGLLEWLWLQAPASPYRFTIELDYTAGLSGNQLFLPTVSLTDTQANVTAVPSTTVTLVPGETFAGWASDEGLPGSQPDGSNIVPGRSNAEVYFFSLLEAGPGEGGRAPYVDIREPQTQGEPQILLYYFYRNIEASDFTVVIEGSNDLAFWDDLDARMLRVQSVDANTELWCAEVEVDESLPQFARISIRSN